MRLPRMLGVLALSAVAVITAVPTDATAGDGRRGRGYYGYGPPGRGWGPPPRPYPVYVAPRPYYYRPYYAPPPPPVYYAPPPRVYYAPPPPVYYAPPPAYYGPPGVSLNFRF